jgi:photosystem II stability/assembly factor-like uncharacterized protein
MAKAGLLFVGTDDGAVLFSNPNNIGRWLRIGQPLRGHAVGALWPLPDNPLVVLAAVEGMSLQRSDDGGQSWVTALDVEASGIAGDRARPEVVYLSTTTGLVYRSTNAGASWVRCGQGNWQPSANVQLLVARHDPPAVYVGLGDGTVWSSHDEGAEWEPFSSQLPVPAAVLADSPAVPGVLYAVGGGALYRGDREGSWRPISMPGRMAVSLTTLAGRDPALLLGLAGGGIERSDDDGATWTVAEMEGAGHSDIAVIAPVGYHVDTAYAGSAEGELFTSTDRGRSWQLVKQGLPPIRSIAAARLA